MKISLNFERNKNNVNIKTDTLDKSYWSLFKQKLSIFLDDFLKDDKPLSFLLCLNQILSAYCLS